MPDKSDATPMRLSRWIQRALWVVIPLLMFGTMELGIRYVIHKRGVWYQRTARRVEQQPVDYLFLGSSRVTAAIDADVFAQSIEQRTGRRPTVDLLARGYTNLIHNYLALRNLTDIHPEHLRGCVVMLELPSGLPATHGSYANTPTGLRGAWLNSQSCAHLLSAVMQTRDLPALYGSDTELERKIELTFGCLSRPICSVSQRQRVHEVFRANLNTLAYKVENRLTPTLPREAASVDLSDRGGIRTDAEGVAVVRRYAAMQARQASANQKPLRNWEDSLLPDLIALCRDHRMQLVFFEMPEAPDYVHGSQTPTRQADRRHFRQWAQGEGVPIIRFDFPTRQADFPDGLHLSQSRGRAYSSALARTFMRQLRDAEQRIVQVEPRTE